MSAAVMARTWFLRNALLVCMIAIDDVTRDVLVEQSRNGLDTEEASNKEPHHDESSFLIGHAVLFQVLSRLGKHTK